MAQNGLHPTPIIRHVTPQGLTLLVEEDATHPLVAIQAVVGTGSATEGEFLGTGISHVLEHMLFKGTQRRAVGEVEREARTYGGTSQGATTYDTTSYDLTINKEFWAQGLDLMVDALFHSSLDPQEFVKERGVVLRELKLREDDPDRILWDLLFSTAYQRHPYRLPIIGYEPLVSALTREDLERYYRAHYHPNTITLAVVGDISAPEVIARVEALTADLSPGRVPLEVLPEEPPILSPRSVTQEAAIQLGMAGIAFHSVELNDPDLEALDLLAYLLGGGRGSRLDKGVQETGIAHAASAWNFTPRSRGLFGVILRMDPDRMEAALEAAWGQMAQIREQGVTAQELERAKKAFLRDHLESRQTVDGIAADLAGYAVLAGDPAFPVRYIAGIQAVSPEQIRQAARRVLQPDRVVTVRLYPKGSRPDRAGREGSAAGERASTRKVQLANGLTLLLQPDHRIPLVTLQAAFWGGVRYETAPDNGIAKIAARMLLRGTRRRNADQLVDYIKSLGASVNSFSGRNSGGVTIEAVASQSDAITDLLSEILQESRFPAEELEKERRLALAGLKAEEEDAFRWGIKRLYDTMFTRHPYRLNPSGSLEGLHGLSADQVRAFHRRLMDPKRMVIGAIGDFDADQMEKKLRQLFGSLKGEGGGQPEVPAEPVRTAPKERREETPRQEGLVLIGLPGLSVEDAEIPTLDLIQSILSGGAGRLFTEVREVRGLAYTVGAFAAHGIEPGAFVLYAVTEPDKIEPVREVLLDQAQRLIREPVSEQELQEARQGLLGAQRIARQTQGGEMGQMTLDELFGLGYDHSKAYEGALSRVTPAQIQALARRLFAPQQAVVLIGEPRAAEGSAPQTSSAPRGKGEAVH
ncbi:MAG: hypothetical protein COV76_05450 [Candidatus Omnitrophica bacterium CG11_big_fil_rev_8_21_14_0_20_64_10]|nr:MAG: hypothetical protein COV76_05450 [Candidatus Omnitrophica bacterium CG11_big_fil_rev_8_21_14_0_20_64_10]